MLEHELIGDRERPTRSRLPLILAALALVWAFVVAFTGGFFFEVGPIRISSRNAINPLLIALGAGVAAWMLAPRGRRGRALIAECNYLAGALERSLPRLTVSQTRWLLTAVVASVSVAVVGFGILRGAFVAGGPDPYGYVSQAQLWLSGIPRAALPWAGALPDAIPPQALVPLGYRLGTDGASLVPTYAPGFPMTMALFARLGGRDAMFYVMPLMAGVAVWTTFILGTMVAGRVAGLIAALFVATSPAFVLQLTHMPMSDIPAMAWWTVALVLLPRASRRSAVLAGVAVGAAILTRPNLTPLALVPAAWLASELVATRLSKPLAVQRLLLFAAASLPACLAVGYLNDYWYGSPLASGYGLLGGTIYRWDYFWPNLAQYTQRILASQSPIVLLAAAGPVLLWKNRMRAAATDCPPSVLVTYTAFAIGVYLCYAFYVPLDTWWTLRFLFPAFPVAFVLLSVALLNLSVRLPRRTGRLAVVLLVAWIASYGIAYGRRNGSFDSTAEWRYAAAGNYIAQKLPERTVVFAVLHAGSVRHYSGRLTIRYDFIAPERFETAVEHFQKQGFPAFLLLDGSEKTDFVARFSGATRLGPIDSQRPVATFDGAAIYDLYRASQERAR